MKLLIVTILFISSFTANALKPEKKYVTTPEKYGLAYKELFATTKDNINIKVWFIPAQDILPIPEILKLRKNNEKREYRTENFRPKPTLILCNGDSGNMSYSLDLAFKYVKNGFNVVLFDWRGFGESDFFPINNNRLFYSEFLWDYEAVINTVYLMDEVKKDSIGLFGFSTGAYLSFATAYKNSKIKCIVVRGLMTSFNDVTKQFYEMKHPGYDRFIIPNKYPIELCPINIASSFTKPSLLIVGKDDDRTPVKMSEKINELLPSEKDLWIVEGAGHGGAMAPEVRKRDEFVERTVKFYKHHLGS
ncbi:alpha/beta hydrolase [Ancylomarina sp. 16SWW S1-10-2]|uniref:alpha/beta hydrolase n=1 Tax=Ancylomarina sp. 16SWW S1-10-2 TaxID=2499681 RepID=UPI0012ADD28B|nr:alpha/beta fold hydrolase [Ancylomarina sp. 16SWW S1-10-2]MRT92660.1 alpha/beta fold hydrolase [Ancylomarina sp. 16SWW S1-10-2]